MQELYLIKLSCDLAKKCNNITLKENTVFSKVTWNLIEAEFSYFNSTFRNDFSPSLKLGSLFCAVFDFEERIRTEEDRNYFFKKNQILDFGILMLIDMIINPDIWNKMGFNPEDMTERYRGYYKIASKIAENDESTITQKIALFRIHLACGEKYYNILKKFALDNNFEDSLSFLRNNKTGFLGLVNKDIGAVTEHNFSFILLRSYIKKRNIELKSINKENFKMNAAKHENIARNILILCLFFDKFTYIKTHCIIPLYNELLFIIENEQTKNFTQIFKKIEDFYNHHIAKSSSPLIATLPILANVVKELGAMCPLIKSGFLLSA